MAQDEGVGEGTGRLPCTTIAILRSACHPEESKPMSEESEDELRAEIIALRTLVVRNLRDELGKLDKT